MSDLYTEILEFEKMKNIDRDQLVEDYVQQMIESMDYKTMECLVYDTLKDNLADYTDEELLGEVTDYYPELLGDVDTV
jgi:hypothetical protein